MISPMTPPGTKVVCINDDPTAMIKPGLRYSAWTSLESGTVYTVAEIGSYHPYGGISVRLVEQKNDSSSWGDVGYAIERFRRLDLPESLTSLLNTTPVDSDMVGQLRVPVPSLVRPPAHQLAGGVNSSFASPASSLSSV